MGFLRFFERRAKHPMLDLARNKRAMRGATNALAEQKAALEVGMLSERKIKKLVRQLRHDSGSFGIPATMLKRQGQLAETALLDVLADPAFLKIEAASNHALDDSPASTAIGLLQSCGTSRCLPTIRRFFKSEDLHEDALLVFGALCSEEHAEELARLLQESDDDGCKWLYLGIKNRFYERDAVEPLRSVLLDVIGEFRIHEDGSPNFEALECIGSIDAGVLFDMLDTEEMLFGNRQYQGRTLSLLEAFKLVPSERFHTRLLTDPESEPNREQVLCVLASENPSPVWEQAFSEALDRIESGGGELCSMYSIQSALARLFCVDHWSTLFCTAAPGDATQEQQTLMMLEELDSQVCNGGFLQYFFNQSGPNWQRALSACQEIGLNEFGALIQQAVDVVGLTPSESSSDDIHRKLGRLTESQGQGLERLDSEFYKMKNLLKVQCIRYILEHHEQFPRPNSD